MSACLPIDGLLLYNTGIQRSLLGGYWVSFFILLASFVIWDILDVVFPGGDFVCYLMLSLKVLSQNIRGVLAVHNKESLPQVVSTCTGYLMYMRSKNSFLALQGQQ